MGQLSRDITRAADWLGFGIPERVAIYSAVERFVRVLVNVVVVLIDFESLVVVVSQPG